jgi:hypothetical protein
MHGNRETAVFLSIGDNTSAIGWIRKSKFKPDVKPEQATHLAFARHVTLLLAELNVIQFGCWLPGKDNDVADALSRRHDMTDDELTKHILLSSPEQTPPGFQIKVLPQEIISWALFWVQHNQDTKQSPPAPLPKVTRGGGDGLSSFIIASSTMTSSCEDSRITNANPSSAHLHTESDRMNGPNPREAMITWLREHAAPPSTLSVRPSARPVGKIPGRTRTATLRSFYNAKCGDTKTMTPRNNRKKRSHSDCL